VSFKETAGSGLLVRVYARHGRIELRLKDQDRIDRQSLPKPRISRYEIEFRLDGDKLKLTTETAAAGNLFGAK